MIKINKFKLDNGLRVLHVEDKSTPLVAINTLYDVGAKDEKPTHTGFAHLMEHLMFGGTNNIPDFDLMLQKAGGQNNAWTNNDLTNYYDIVPKENAEFIFYVESDRMRGLSFSKQSLLVQKQVVCEEFKQRNLNKPYGDLMEILRKMVFKHHPYQWLTIGKELKHIEKTTIDDVKEFFYEHYAPNNAILSVVGNISLDETQRLVLKWYSSIPSRNIKKRLCISEPIQSEPRFEEVSRKVASDCIVKAYHAPNIWHKDYYASDNLTDILSYNNSSWLPLHLVQEKQKFTQIDAYVASLFDEGVVQIKAIPRPEVSLEEADQLIQEEITHFLESPIEEREMQRIRNAYEADKLYPMPIDEMASDIAEFELRGDANLFNQQIEMHNSVTADDIKRVAKDIFKKENCSTLYYKKQ